MGKFSEWQTGPRSNFERQIAQMRIFWRKVNLFLPMRMVLMVSILFFVIILPLLGYFGALQYSAFFQPSDNNYASYLVRNRGDGRVAKAETYFRQLKVKNALPYRYPDSALKLLNTSQYSHVALSSRSPAPSRKLSVVIMCHNRDTHEVDAYEPHYLTQTVHALLHSIDADVSQFGPRWGNISVRLCNVDAHPHECRECERIHNEILTGRAVPKWDFEHEDQTGQKIEGKSSKSKQQCLAQRQFAYCLSQTAQADPASEVVLLEDDLVARHDALQALWHVMDSLGRRFTSSSSSSLGLVQIYTPMHRLSYSLGDTSTYLELVVLGGVLTIILLGIQFRLHLRAFHLVYNFLFIGILFTLCVTFVVLVGRPHWLQAYHALTRHYSLGQTLSTEHLDLAGVLLHNHGATALASYVQHLACSESSDKSKAVHLFLRENEKQVLALYPSALKHVGLYSHFRGGIWDPHHVDA